MSPDPRFRTAFHALEERMEMFADAREGVFLPGIPPEGPVQYFVVCMEPSLGRWARSLDEARSKVRAGFRNFVSDIDAILLHFCLRRYLCAPGQRYHITDLSKAAMLVRDADQGREERYDRWFPLLEEELALVAAPDAHVIAVGKVVHDYLKRLLDGRRLTPIIHYSALAGNARVRAVQGREEEFRRFRSTVSMEDVMIEAEDIVRTGMPALWEETLAPLRRSRLTVSRLQLIFSYKTAFEAMHFAAGRSPLVADLRGLR